MFDTHSHRTLTSSGIVASHPVSYFPNRNIYPNLLLELEHPLPTSHTSCIRPSLLHPLQTPKMGQTHSNYGYPSNCTPPPLVEVSAPGGRIMVPPHTALTVHPSRRRMPPRGMYEMYDGDEGDSESEESVSVGIVPTRRAFGRGSDARGLGGRPRSVPLMRGGYGSPGMWSGGLGGGGPGMNIGMGMGPPGAQMLGNPTAHHAMMPSSPDLPPGYSSMTHLPPRYSAGGGMPMPPTGAAAPPGTGQGQVPNPYSYAQPGSPHSTASSTPHRRRSPGAHEHIPLGAFAKSAAPATPKIPRAHTSPAERINRKPSGGHEWLKGDSFLDACICTPSCPCREGHRVLYRSRKDNGGSGDEGGYGQGEIRYILKKDLGRNCGDHSACREGEGAGSEEEGKSSKNKEKEQKKEDKRRKEEMKGLKEDLLEALDERFEKMRKRGSVRGSRSSKAGSVGMGSPRPAFAGLGGAFPGMGLGGQGANAGVGPAGLDPRMGDGMGGMPMMGMGVNMPATLGGGNPYTTNMPGQNMAQRPSGMPHLMAGARPMRPGQMAMTGMLFEDDMSMVDMDAMGMGNPCLASNLKTKGLQDRFLSPGRPNPGGVDREEISYYRNLRNGNDRAARFLPRRANRHHLPPRGGGYDGSEDYSSGPRRPGPSKRGGKARQDSFDKMAVDADDRDPRRVESPLGNGVRNSHDRDQGRHHPRVETDDDDAY
ncbi:hypothetical protein IQ06DRAFT_358567 [Phaeosphaeriaceae sp. SRC1lsM3a]|nr:hypothetical protein IQ06DRAFT_358567 [Stagonospora sp. SRC1lsM3a]